jgi:hypothetical protein
MNQIQLAITSLLVFSFAGCKSNHEQHNTGIGRTYTFTSFNLISPTGAVFALSAGEMRELEKVWSRPLIPGSSAITNRLIASSPKLRYSFVLNDGYTTETLEAFLGTLSGVDCLGVLLQGDGGGFTGDVHDKFVPITSVFSTARRSELESSIGAITSPPDPTKRGEQDGGGQPATRPE